jgi:hypothetical protein
MTSNRWLRRYRTSLRFASFYNSEFRFDIVHNCWLYFFEKTGTDLFLIDLDNEDSYLYTCVKTAFLRWVYHEKNHLKEPVDRITTTITPHDIVEAADYSECFYKNLASVVAPKGKNKDLPLRIFRLRASGYNNEDIADAIGTSKQLVGMYVNKIERLTWKNPFPGSNTQIFYTMSIDKWESKERIGFTLEDSNEDFKLFVKDKVRRHSEGRGEYWTEGWLIRL